MYAVSEMEKLQEQVEKLTYEKIAIDQAYVESLKSALTLRSSLLCYEAQNKELNEKVSYLENELQNLKEAFNRTPDAPQVFEAVAEL